MKMRRHEDRAKMVRSIIGGLSIGYLVNVWVPLDLFGQVLVIVVASTVFALAMLL